MSDHFVMLMIFGCAFIACLIELAGRDDNEPES